MNGRFDPEAFLRAGPARLPAKERVKFQVFRGVRYRLHHKLCFLAYGKDPEVQVWNAIGLLETKTKPEIRAAMEHQIGRQQGRLRDAEHALQKNLVGSGPMNSAEERMDSTLKWKLYEDGLRIREENKVLNGYKQELERLDKGRKLDPFRMECMLESLERERP